MNGQVLACLTLLFALLATTVYANTEKVIFLAPPSVRTSDSELLITNLASNTLTPDASTLRTSLSVQFPSTEQAHGVEHWYLLRSLTAKQRYEVRICWAATQPTDFSLHVFDLPEILKDQGLLRSIGGDDPRAAPVSSASDQAESILGLRIRATADYFTTNQTLMRHPPSVDVDIILDPYLANAFPVSLLPTAVYIVILAVVGWYVSDAVWSFLQTGASTGKSHID